MTNAEKFYEVFGTKGWVDWDAEYQGTPTIPLSVIEEIKAEIHKEINEVKFGGWYEVTEEDAIETFNAIIDKAVKECIDE